MKLEILTIGNELLSGVILDGNAAWLAGRLFERGVLPSRKTTVLDEVEAIAAALGEAAARGAQVVVACGGLGPTEDDLSAEGAARAAGVELALHPEARAQLEARFAHYGIELTARQLEQARLPAGCEVLDNPRGTAPGFALTLGGTTAFFLPGPPREFRPMVEAAVLPFVDARLEGPAFASLNLRTFGQPEARLADRVVASGVDLTGIELGYRLEYPEINLRLRASGPDPDAARARCEAAAAGLEAALAPWAYARGELGLPALVGRLLVDAGLTLALGESCTGGLLGALITDVPGASRYLLLSAVTYADAMKTRVLEVPAALLAEHGAVSEAAARAMAEGALRLSGAHLAVSITGIAGPGGATPEKPVGTVFLALAEQGRETRGLHRRLLGDREQIRRLSAYVALDFVRRRLTGLLDAKP